MSFLSFSFCPLVSYVIMSLFIFICFCICLGGLLRLIDLFLACHRGFQFLMNPHLPMSFLLGIYTSKIMLGFYFIFRMRMLKMMVACSCSFWMSKMFKTTWRQHLKLQHCKKIGGGVNKMPLCSGVDTTKWYHFFLV